MIKINLQLFGGGGGSSGGNYKMTGRRLPFKGRPNSTYDLYKNGKRVQRRYYDKDGNPSKDVDYQHGGADGIHSFPHYHDWVNGKRGKGYK